MSWLDFAILLGFLIYAAWAGFGSKDKASQNLEEYFLAGRSLKGWQAGLSMAATQFASDTPLLVTGLIATAGVFAIWQMWIYALSFLLVGFLLAPCWRRSRVLTDAELTELRYGEKSALVLRLIKAIYFGTIFNCTVLAWVFFAATKIAEPFLLWDQWLPAGLFSPFVSLVETVGIPLTLNNGLSDAELWAKSASNFISVITIVMITFLYSSTGGLRAVVKTDVAQLFLMLGATALYAFYVVKQVGGMDVIVSKIYEMFSSGQGGLTAKQVLAFTPDQAAGVTGPLLAVFGLQWLIQLNSDGTGAIAQRSMACQTDRDAKIAAIVFTFVQILFRSLLWLPIALGLLVYYSPDFSLTESVFKAEREATFVMGIRDLLPMGVMGVMVTGMLAALASTVDTHLNWGASYWTNDIYKRFICEICLKKTPDEKSLVWVARGSNLLILIISLIIGTQLTSIQDTWQISLLLGAGIGIVLVLRWFWWKMTAWAEISAVVGSLALAPWAYYSFDSQMMRLLIVATGCTTISILVALFGKREEEARLKEFYNRVKPPGFWGPFSSDQKADQQTLWRGFLATITCAISVFSLLVGLGSWLIDSPAPSFFPHQGLWITFNILLGLGMIPLWRKFGMKPVSE